MACKGICIPCLIFIIVDMGLIVSCGRGNQKHYLKADKAMEAGE